MNPNAMILMMASIRKTKVVTMSNILKDLRISLSGSSKGESNVKVTEDAIMNKAMKTSDAQC